MDKSSSSEDNFHTPESVTPTDAGERAWKIAQLAAVLAQADLKGPSPVQLQLHSRLASKGLDSHFAAALKRADMLLSWAEGKQENVHAYQLFEEGETFTKLRITDIFKNAGWSSLKAKASVTNLMESLLKKCEEDLQDRRLNCTKAAEDVLLLRDTIDEAIVGAFEDYMSCSRGPMPPSIQGCCDELRSCVMEKLSNGLDGQFHRGRWVELCNEEAFFKWCFPEPTAGDRAERLYRPYEIFRRCAARGWETAKLVRARGQLNCIPYPPENPRLESYQIFDKAHAHLIPTSIGER
jgi:hypothetical protein